MSARTLFVLIVCVVVALLFEPAPAMAAKSPLVGSWQITLTPNAPPTPPVIPAPGLATFTTDGSVVETDGTELAPGPASTTGPTFGSPGHGIWQLLPSLTGFYIQWNSVTVNANGSLHSSSVTVATASVVASSTGTTLSGQYTTTITTSGGVVNTITGKITGTLIPHPLLP